MVSAGQEVVAVSSTICSKTSRWQFFSALTAVAVKLHA
jgi:hypothetical protein